LTIWDKNSHPDKPRNILSDLEVGASSEESLETLSSIAKSRAGRTRLLDIEVSAVIDPDTKAVVQRINAGVNREFDGPGVLGDPIFHRVFHQGLQKHGGNLAFQGLGLDNFPDREPILETEQLKLEIVHDKT
jgi:hypothetical protein